MRMGAGLALGFAAGVLALGVFLYSTGRLVLPGSPTKPAVATAPTSGTFSRLVDGTTLPPPNPAIPVVSAAPLPAPPNPALTAAPPATQSMPINGNLENHGPVYADAKSDALVLGLPLPNLKLSSIQDTFNDTRGGGTQHEATDILAPRGTPVFAVVEGNVVKLFNSKKGGITVYQYDNQQKYCYYYAHLDHYINGLKEGMLLRKGDTLGYVGSTGDAQAGTPHLHFAILQLGPDKHWYEHTTAINPYPHLVNALNAK